MKGSRPAAAQMIPPADAGRIPTAPPMPRWSLPHEALGVPMYTSARRPSGAGTGVSGVFIVWAGSSFDAPPHLLHDATVATAMAAAIAIAIADRARRSFTREVLALGSAARALVVRHALLQA